MASCIMDSDESRQHLARILNPSPTPVSIRRGMVLGLAEGIDSSETSYTQEDIIRRSDTESDGNNLPEHLQKMFEDSSAGLTPPECDKLRGLLTKYSTVFSKNEDDLGCTHLVEHAIDTGDATPVKFPPRRVPLAYVGEDKKALDQLMRRGCIRPSASPWGAPLVFVRKKDGSVRCCMDNRRLNAVTVKDAYPLPRTEDCIDALSGATLFSTMDITSAYNQVPIKEEDIPKTAFVTKYGLFEHVTMCFGLCNAPSTFQRLMEIVLAGLQWQTCLVYLDDVIIYSRTFNEHLDRLEGVLQRIRESGLKLKPKKCHLLQEEVTFLGHVISSKGILPDPSNVQKLQDWPTPTKVKDVRAFLGLGNYYKKFVKDYSQLVKPLTSLTQKNAAFTWTAECQESFEKLKSILLGPDIMSFPQHGAPYILDTDACDVAIGAVLSQIQDGRERVIAYGSRTLNKSERNFCVTDRECLAVKYFCEYYRHHLLGLAEPFTIRTDHQALQWLLTMKEPKGRIARWIEALSCFNFEIQYRKGLQHGNADAMSRCTTPTSCTCEDPSELKCGPCKKCIRRSEMMKGTFHQEEEDLNPSLIRLATVSEAAEGENTSPHDELEQINSVTTRSKGHWALPYNRIDLRNKQLEDPDIKPIMEWKENMDKPKCDDVIQLSPATRHYWLTWDSLELKEGVLYRKFSSKNGLSHLSQFIVPQSLKKEILHQMHNTILGGQKKTIGRINSFFWFDMKTDVNFSIA